MGRIEKTVFISYRRANIAWALNIFQDLTSHGYDVFFDYLSIDSGNFESVIIENIKARAHFILLLTPSALEECKHPNDWLRREIEMALAEKRNVVPIMLEGFDYDNPLVVRALVGSLEPLRQINGLRLYAEYFFEAMERLRQRYLNIAVEEVKLTPLSTEAKEITNTQKEAANNASPFEISQLAEEEKDELLYSQQQINLPVIGRIGASTPIPIPESEFSYFDRDWEIGIATPLFPRGTNPEDLFALEVDGDSMIDAMVRDGDYIVLKKINARTEIRNGEMVAIWLPAKHETTLKYIYEEKDRYRLQPANPTMKPIYINKNEPLEIKGKVIMVIRNANYKGRSLY